MIAKSFELLASKIRDAGNLALEVGSRAVSTNYTIPVGHALAARVEEHRLKTLSEYPIVESALSSKDRSPPKNITDTSWPLRTPITWRSDGGSERYDIDPWAVLEAQQNGDDSEVTGLLAPTVGNAAEFRL